MANDNKVAFAIGGLAGNNAHGAGFLQAALDENVVPAIISCTSGQILWAFRYLQNADLKKELADDIDKIRPTKNYDIDTVRLMLLGIQGVYRPAFPEYMKSLIRNGFHFLQTLMEERTNTFLLREFSRIFPGRMLVPEFSDRFLADVCEIFNKKHRDIGIAFNSFDPQKGCELVYCNGPAMEFCGAKSESGYRQRTDYEAITEETVRDALWLYQYGFSRKGEGHLDGAYYRQIMLDELTCAHDIFVARPVNYCWKGNLPTHYVGIEDLKTAVGFNGSYAGERNKIHLVNKFIERNGLGPPYHHINLHEIEMEAKRGYFDYIYESLDVFMQAYERAVDTFKAFRHKTAALNAGGEKTPGRI